ncbi:MAG: UDP-glucose dehydrogenase family protein [Nitrososphaerales archaeon]
MHVCVVGLGYVGLSMATVMAHKGISVIGVDNNEERCSLIKKGKAPFFEPKLDDLLNTTLGKNLQITSDLNYALANCQICFISVGTPSYPDDSPNLSFIEKVSLEIGRVLNKLDNGDFRAIAIKSTVPPSTTETRIKSIMERVSGKKAGIDFGVCMNPEFLREGSAVEDMFSPHLIVIGVTDERTKIIMLNLYRELYSNSLPRVLVTNIINAELIKYANNAFLATKISFINTIANVCSKIPGADVEIIAKAIGYDPRISPLFLKAGPGYGGSCLPKDVSGLLSFCRSIGYDPILLESIQLVNQNQALAVLQMIQDKINDLQGRTISVLGLSFKKNTDDIREAVSIRIVQTLLELGASVKVHDPMALDNFRKLFHDKLIYCENMIDCLRDAHCCVILAEWDEFKTLTSDDFRKYMKNPCVVDTLRVLEADKMTSIDYSAVGYGRL